MRREPEAGLGAPGWRLHRVLFAAFLLDLLLVAFRLWQPGWLAGHSRVPESMLVILGAASTLSSLARDLPAQNVVLAAVLIAVLSFGGDLLSAAAGLPLVQRPGANASGLRFVRGMPLIRVFEILSSRGVARLLVGRRRPDQNHGLWVLALTAVLVVLFELNLQPYATVVSGYWSWGPAGNVSGWYGMPWLAVAAWALTALVIAALIAPSLINIRPSPIATDPRGNQRAIALRLAFSPFGGWVSANLLFMAGAASRGLWPGAALIALELGLIATLTLRFARAGADRLPN